MCYSDHNHDIAVKGTCDYCGSDLPDPTESLLQEVFATLGR